MAHKVIGYAFADSNNSLYIEKQIDAIKNSLPDLDIELGDETESRLVRYFGEDITLPAYVVYKHDKFKDKLIGKYDTNHIINWLNSIHGLNA